MLLVDENNDAYIIYGDFLPNAAIPQTAINAGHLQTGGTYRVWSNEDDSILMNALSNSSNWSSFISSDLSQAAQSLGKTATAVGTPSLDIFKQSWNTKYTEEQGWVTSVGDEWGWSLDEYIGSTEGYAVSAENNMYYPRKDSFEDGDEDFLAYWTSSMSTNGGIMMIYNGGGIYYYDYDRPYCGICPVIKMPASLLQLNASANIWSVTTE
ncbi:MAG: hypothetical protein K6B70_08110 [Clostridia bacterium]|nr:hypothetical protein [Clostridia bacterium]